MRTILLVALLCPLLCVSPGAIAQSKAPPDPPPAPFSPSSPTEPDTSADPVDAAAPSENAKPVAPDAPANPGSVTVRRPAILHWWDHPAFDRRVTLVVKDADLNTAIDALGKAANISLIAAGGTKARKKVTLNLRGAPLRDVMLAVANLYGLTWFAAGEVYTLTYVSASARKAGATGPALPRPRRPVIVIPERSGAGKSPVRPKNQPGPAPDPADFRINSRDPNSPASGR